MTADQQVLLIVSGMLFGPLTIMYIALLIILFRKWKDK